MAKNVVLRHYGETIEVGTRADDGRLSETALFIRVAGKKRALSSSEALQLAAVLLEVVRDQAVKEKEGN